MAVKMRLRRMGAKHQPSYRIVIMPALTPRDGSYLDQVGFYDPVPNPATIRIDRDKAVEWLRKGAEPTDTVARLLTKFGIDPVAVRRGEELPPVPERPTSSPSGGVVVQEHAPASTAAVPFDQVPSEFPSSVEPARDATAIGEPLLGAAVEETPHDGDLALDDDVALRDDQTAYDETETP